MVVITEITKRGMNVIIIPEGCEQKGWEEFYNGFNEILSLATAPNKRTNQGDEVGARRRKVIMTREAVEGRQTNRFMKNRSLQCFNGVLEMMICCPFCDGQFRGETKMEFNSDKEEVKMKEPDRGIVDRSSPDRERVKEERGEQDRAVQEGVVVGNSINQCPRNQRQLEDEDGNGNIETNVRLGPTYRDSSEVRAHVNLQKSKDAVMEGRSFNKGPYIKRQPNVRHGLSYKAALLSNKDRKREGGELNQKQRGAVQKRPMKTNDVVSNRVRRESVPNVRRTSKGWQAVRSEQSQKYLKVYQRRQNRVEEQRKRDMGIRIHEERRTQKQFPDREWVEKFKEPQNVETGSQSDTLSEGN